jgi:DNA-binding MarR family transcriptional regulator
MIPLAGRKGRILEALIKNPSATPVEIAKACGITPDNVYVLLSELRKKGAIKKQISYAVCVPVLKNGKYVKPKA